MKTLFMDSFRLTPITLQCDENWKVQLFQLSMLEVRTRSYVYSIRSYLYIFVEILNFSSGVLHQFECLNYSHSNLLGCGLIVERGVAMLMIHVQTPTSIKPLKSSCCLSLIVVYTLYITLFKK